ncbi:WD repeat-containing protein 6 [Sesamum alatum]|uniref:WD repeat-containing protein 6 n=1 Tax=Sesamum alatum TaxID=300844 RepID=A0AAE1XUT8_9LAMI|nr:WD repeat-containing protein 6 [Sesamum alatum]
MDMTDQSHWQLLRRQYLGEISALCFLPLPTHFSSLPLLLAGTGSQILVYDLVSGKIIRSFPVFEGIRVHGISVEHFHKPMPASALAFRIAVFGERRVKLFSLQIESDTPHKPFLDMELTLIHALPKFGHWVLDVCFLKNGATSSEDACHLAIGCSDNSIYFWDISRCNIFSEVKCAERCLLYSMRMLGNDIESLRIASGTIFNEIVVWKVVHQNHSTNLRSNAEDHVPLTSNEDFLIPGSKYKDTLISRLVGHEGSIFRIAWFSNGMKLVSVSDDRSARIWEVQADKGVSCKDRVNHLAGPVLFGHSARIWDCCIYDSLIITAGEDCTCRVWDHDGRELNVIKEHIGRGVWRCLYDPCSSLLVTAGFDSAIKLHKIYTSSKGLEETTASEDFSDRKELFALSIPNTSGRGGLMDSKSEYVRCLHFSREDSLYVATNNGYLYHASLYNNEALKWTELARISEEAPIICMDLLSKFTYPAGGFEDWIAVGDGKGRMTIVLVVGTGGSPKVESTLTWPAEKERHLLGSYWCKSLDNRFIFTSDPGGGLKLWKLCHNSHSASLIGRGSCDVSLIAEYASCFGMRIMCVDASFDEELLVCGDIRGNLLLFSLPRGLLCGTSIAAEVKASPVNYFKGAHGVSSVSSVSIYSPSSDQVEIRSTGADGCICYLQHNRDMLNLEFIGMKQVKELSAIRSVFTTTDQSDDFAVGNYAVGFASANFIIWNLTTGTKVLDITCGGWRRPHSYYLGDLPEMMNCFSFVKDDVIYIHRNWVPESDRQIYPRNLHLQFHGREVHSLCFIYGHSLCSSDEDQGLVSESSWIATGCEDGTVRLTRYEPGMENWLSSQHLGEHVGGSAVRSVCSVSKMHIFVPASSGMPNVVYRQNGTLEDRDPFILISVGAKRVVTAWKQMITMSNNGVDSVCRETDKKNVNNLRGPSTENVSSFSFQWLSTDMPFKHTSYAKRQCTKEVLETDEDLSTTTSDAVSVELLSSRCRKKEANLCPEDDLENDWRYLDVTAFLVKECGSRISVCFVIVACSDATVTLRALVLPFRLWFDVALLAPLSSPVLALQHVVIPKVLPSNGNIQIGSLYLAITGSTDGSIGIWDLTECVENFMRQISGLQMENCMEFQKRPRTGRGSQGGRWWRSIGSHSAKKKPHNCDLIGKTNTGLVSVGRTESDNKMENQVYGTSETSLSGKGNAQVPLQVDNQASFVSGSKKDDLSPEPSVLVALHVLGNVHQSGVNCLNVSDVQDLRSPDSRFSFYIISGGDDQAINCLRCDLKINPMIENTQNMSMKIHCSTLPVAANKCNGHCLIKKHHQMQFYKVDKIISAHSSAVKGIWTDGSWVFSVGLDQRVRCWKLGNDRLSECAHLIISVPEPEALDVRTCGRNHYQIAVAGRGMQMIEFRPSNGMIK